MKIDLYILAFAGVTVLVTIWMGFRSAKKSKTASDFFVAGRSVSVGWNASAISGEYLSAASFMGIAGMVMSSGYDALWYPVCYACGYLFLLLFIAGPLRRFGAYTIPDFAEGRFDSPVFRKIAVVFVLFIGFFYTMPQMKGAGVTLAYIFPGLPYWVGVVLVGAVITLNVALGGMKGITLVQAFQYWAKMFAISVPIFVLMSVYGHYGKQVGVNRAASAPPAQAPFHFHTLASEISPMPRPRAPMTLAQVIADVRARADSLLHRRRRPIGIIPAGAIRYLEIDANQFLEFYQDLSGRTVLKLDSPPMGFPKLSYTNTAPLTVTQALAEAEAAFATIDWGFVPVDEYVTIVAPRIITNEVAQFVKAEGIGFRPVRVPLPAKAPADATWLNPFGPLTTKAAKNAAAAMGRQATEQSGTRGALPSNDSIPLRADIMPGQHLTVALDAPTVAQALAIYAELTGRKLVPNTNSVAERVDDLLGGKLSQLKLISRGGVPDSGVRFHNDGMFTAGEVKAEIEKRLSQQGWTLKPQGKSGFALEKRPINTTNGGSAATATISGDTANLSRGTAEVSRGTAWLSRGTAGVNDSTAGVNDGTAWVSGGTAWPSGQAAGLSRGTAWVSDGAARPSGPTANLLHGSFGLAAPPLSQAVTPLKVATAALDQGAAPLAGQTNTGNGAGAAAVEKAWLATHEKPLALLYTYSLIIAIVCGTAGLPHILVRFYTNPDGAAAKRTTMWVMILIGVFYVFPPVFGVLGRNLLPDLYDGIGAKGTDKIVLELPRILNAKYPPLGSVLSGIACAGAFAAFMSTFSGLLVSMTGALAHDVYGRILRPRATADERMRMFKMGAVIIGGVAILLGMQVEQLQINFMVGQAFAIAAASYFPLLFMAVWWRQLTMKGAATGMLTGGLLALTGISLTSFSDLKWINLADFWAWHPLLRILCEQPAIWTVPLAMALMVMVSKLTAQTVPPDIRMKMLVLHAPEQLGLKQEYIQEHRAPGH